MLKFSRAELMVLSVLLAIGLLAVGYRLGHSAKSPASVASASQDMRFTPAPSPSPAPTPAPANPAAPSAPVQVHVAGAVVHPGVYRLSAGSRTEDAIRAAGGFAAGAQPNVVNLAAPLKDGDQIIVPSAAQPAPMPPARSGAVTQMPPARPQTSVPIAATPVSKPAPSADMPPNIGIISLNRADQAQLDKLPGVGPGLAQRILDYRQAHGGFRNVDELKDIPGIGDKRFERIRLYVTL